MPLIFLISVFYLILVYVSSENRVGKNPGFFIKNPTHWVFFNKTRVLLGFMGFSGILGFLKRKENQKVSYRDSKIIIMC